jgi:hypothetical protein
MTSQLSIKIAVTMLSTLRHKQAATARVRQERASFKGRFPIPHILTAFGESQPIIL